MRLFVKAKHWQLFIVLFGCMIAPSFFIFESAIPFAFEAFTIIFMLGFFGWLWPVGSECNKRTPVELQKSPLPVLFGLVYAALYAVVFSILLAPEPGDIESSNMAYILPFHLGAMACIFYSLGYTAKRLVTLQRGQKVGFFEYSGPFFMFWFFPLGIWFIQPKVNSLLGSSNA